MNMSAVNERRAKSRIIDPDDPGAFHHCFANANNIRMHYVDEGQGPLVILLHGIPYLWYLWRRQIVALADAGYRVVAPDLRGFGQTDCPPTIPAYDIHQSVNDISGLMRALDETSAVIVGHDLGAWVAQYAAMLRPNLFRAAVCSMPVRQRAWKSRAWLAGMAKDKMFYQWYFQQVDKPDREMGQDIRKTLSSVFYSISGDAKGDERWRLFVEPGESILDTFAEPKVLRPWLSERFLDHYVDEYTRTGFTGALNYYRCRDRNWEITALPGWRCGSSAKHVHRR